MRTQGKYILGQLSAPLLVGLFVYTAVSKLLERDVFRYVLTQSPLLENVAPMLSLALPLSELMIAGLLLVSRTQKTGLWCSMALMVLFTGYIGYMLLTSSTLPCSCGGVLQEMSWTAHLFFNLVFTGIALAGALWGRNKRQLRDGAGVNE